MPEIKPEQLLLFAGFVLPGAISMYVYGLKIPQKDFRLQERLLEAICFSLLNFVIVWLPVRSLASAEPVGSVAQWLVSLVAFIFVPALWPFLLVELLRFAEAKCWIAVRARTAWDDFFSRQRTGIWMQVELLDGQVIGGKFGKRSYASAYPDPGHLFIEELWKVDSDGYFVEQWEGGAGILLRPSDYKLVRVFQGAES